MTKINPRFINVLSLIFLLFTAIFADAVTNSRRMFNRRHVLVSLCILLFTGIFPGTNAFSAATLLLPLMVLLFKELTQLYTTTNIRTTIVNTGIIAGTCYLLYHPFLFVLPACFIGLAIMRTFRLSEWMLLILGLITPAYFVLSFEYLADAWQPSRHLPDWPLKFSGLVTGWYWWLAIGTAMVWIFAALGGWQQQTRRMLIQGRKNWLVMLVLGIFCLPGLFFPQANSFTMLTLLAFPAGSTMANAFTSERKAVGHIVAFWLIILVIGIVSWGWKTGAM